MLQIFYQVWRPVVVNLETPHLNSSVLNVNPVIRHDIAHSPDVCLVYKVELRYKNTKSHVITIWKACSDPCRICRNIIHSGHKVLDRH